MRLASNLVHRRPVGQLRAIMRRGVGQLPAGSFSSCAAYLAANLAALPAISEANMLLNTGSPSGAVLAALFINDLPSTPAQTAQTIVTQLAQEFCGWSADQVVFGGALAADCADGGSSAAAAAYPAWLAYYSALPASVWISGTVSPSVANPTLNLPVTAPAPPVVYQAGVPVVVSTAPTPVQQANPVVSNPQSGGLMVGNSAPVPTVAAPDPLAFLTDEQISGVPNWMLLAGGLGLVILLPALIGGRH